MRCPECGSPVRDGSVSGVFRFHPHYLVRERVLEAARTRRTDEITAADWQAYSQEQRSYRATVTARAAHCRRCHWMNIDCASLTLSRRAGTVMRVNPAGEGADCPVCQRTLHDGFVRATLCFTAANERSPGYLRRVWIWWRHGAGARAEARCCYACGWIGIDCATLIEVVMPSIHDRIEDH